MAQWYKVIYLLEENEMLEHNYGLRARKIDGHIYLELIGTGVKHKLRIESLDKVRLAMIKLEMIRKNELKRDELIITRQSDLKGNRGAEGGKEV
jgi:hypothetical protein